MKRLSTLLVLVLAAATFAAVPAKAADAQVLENAVGLMVKYRPGVEAVAQNGQPTGENFAGAPLTNSRDIGNGFRALDFAASISEDSAAQIAANLRKDPRVEVVAIDHDYSITPQTVARRLQAQLAQTLVSALRPATSPQNVTVVDAWSPSYPTTPRIRVSWTAPTKLNGGKLGGFQILKSVNGAKFTVASTISNPKSRFAYLSLGLEAGRPTRVLVKAITKLSSAVKLGLASKAPTVTPTTKPIAPKITGYSDNQVAKPKWTPLSLSERGGLPVTYRATATATGKPTLSCSTAETTCELTGFSADSNYSITVTATNSRGASRSLPVVRPREPYFYEQWYLYSDFGVNAPAAWAQLPAVYPNEVVVAVVDSGIASHSDLNAQLVPGYDFVSLDQLSNDGDGWDADASDPGSFSGNPGSVSAWHGTHVAGLIGAAANGQGITGVAPGVKLQSVRALGGSGGKSSDLVAAVTWASGGAVGGVPMNPTPAKVVNISMGTALPTSCDAGLQAAFTAAIARGVTIITSAGNGNVSNTPMLSLYSYPGNCFGSITVGATNSAGGAAHYSNYGIGVDVSAPGGDERVTSGAPEGSNGRILSTFNTGATTPATENYAYDIGTSMSAPLVSGAVALFYAKNSNMTSELAWAAIKSGVKKFQPGSACALTVGTANQRCGAGILDIGASLRLVK